MTIFHLMNFTKYCMRWKKSQAKRMDLKIEQIKVSEITKELKEKLLEKGRKEIKENSQLLQVSRMLVPFKV